MNMWEKITRLCAIIIFFKFKGSKDKLYVIVEFGVKNFSFIECNINPSKCVCRNFVPRTHWVWSVLSVLRL